MVPQLQKAFILPVPRGRFTIGQVPVPQPGPREVLVKVLSAALNPVEWNIQAYGIFVNKYPAILGSDGAGIVEQVGEDVTTLVKGDKIMFQGDFQPAYGTFQQYSLVPAELTSKVPPNISLDQAATVPVGIATVILGMYNQHPNSTSVHFTPPWEESGRTAHHGEPILILGGSSTVGQCAIQIAKYAGYTSIITTASLRNNSLLTSLGATHVLDRTLSQSELISQIRNITGDTQLFFAFDAISTRDTQLLAYNAVAPGGKIVLTLPSQIPSQYGIKEEERKTAVVVFGSTHPPQNRDISVAMCQRLTGWLESGILKPNSVEVLPGGLEAITAGLERLKSERVSATKLVVHPHEE